MHELAPALAGLSTFAQFVLYRLVPDAATGKNTKLPCNHLGEIVDAHNPRYWMSAELACQWSTHTGYGVAFVFTENDPFFFIDIDSCLEPTGNWSHLATTMSQAFAGCAIEISSSGNGLHIIGTGEFGAHAKKNTGLNIELYTEKRFVALTGTAAVGDVRTLVTPVITEWLTTYYFKPRDRLQDANWTDAPAPEWNGPVDDDDLLRRARNARSAASAFSGRASFDDLWTANLTALSATYPSKTGKDFDHSSADMALASHLMFWTGRDCARVERLMRQSGLVRDKWDTRVDYLYETVSEAKSINRDVCKDRQIEPVALMACEPTAEGTSADPVSETVVVQSRVVEGQTYLPPESQQELFEGCVYVLTAEACYVPKLGMLKRSQFNVHFGGYSFVLDRQNQKTSFDAWETFTNSRCVRFPQVHDQCFRPDLQPGEIIEVNGVRSVNTYRPANVIMREGDPTPFLTHLTKLLPVERDRDIYLSYLAGIIQNPGMKFRWAPVLQGVEGNGKTFFSNAMQYAVGKVYTHWPKASQISKNFNKWMYENLLYCVEDFGPSKRRDEIMEDLKPMITGEDIEIEGKGIDQRSREVCGNFLFNMNHKGSVRKTRKDRRFAVFYTPQQEVEDLERDGLTGEYLGELFDWAKGTGAWVRHGRNYGFSIIAHFLATYPIPDQFNPATKCQRAPITSSADEAVVDSFGVVEMEVMEAIGEGRMGFKNGWVSGKFLKEIVEASRRTLSATQRTTVMKTLGYQIHPGLPEGRTRRPVAPDAIRTVLYVRTGTMAAKFTDAERIASDYEAAQRDN